MIEKPTIDPADELICLGHREDPTEHAGAAALINDLDQALSRR